jgi:hypothetical protein
MKDPLDKHRLIIDPATAPIVRQIFQMSADGIGTHRIAKALTLDGVHTPKDISRGTYTGAEWQAGNICKILRNKVYLGHMVSNKQPKPSFKSNKRIRTEESEWIEVHGTHDAIVTQEVFDLVQRRLGVKKRRNSGVNENIFVGLVKCKDCGSSLTFMRNTYSGIVYLTCVRSRNIGSKKCSPHYIQYVLLQQLVLEGIQENAAIVKANQHDLENFIKKSLAGRSSQSKKADRAALAKLNRRKEELSQIIKRLFEENVLGKMPSERFYEMSTGYETEAKDVSSRIEKLQASLSSEDEYETNYRHFCELMLQYVDVQKLDATMLNMLIDRIDVHAPEGRGSKRTQEVDVYYRFIGKGLASPKN